MAFNQPHPRLSMLSSTSGAPSPVDHFSPSAASSRFSLTSSSPVHAQNPVKSVVKSNIYDRNLNKTRAAEVSLSAYAFLFSEMIQYTQKRVNGINDLEKRYLMALLSGLFQFLIFFDRLNILGYRIGSRVFELMTWRAESASRTPKREIRFLPALMSIHTQVWRAVFAKPADAIEKSVEHDDECMFFLLFYFTNTCFIVT